MSVPAGSAQFRMRARPHLHYAPVPDGVYFSGARRQFVIKGPPLLFTIADVSVSLLEEGATEDELVAALRSERVRPAVQQLCRSLRDHGMLLDPARFTAAEPGSVERARHPDSLAHLESFSDDPYAAFARLRAATALLCGHPRALLPAARGLARSGVGQLILATGEQDETKPTADRLGAGVVAVAPSALAQLGNGVQAVLYCITEDGDQLLDDFVLDRTDSWLPDGVPLVPVWFGSAVMLVGPVLYRTADRQRWSAFKNQALSWASPELDGPVPRPIGDALAGALAAQLVFELLSEGAAADEAHVVHGAALLSDSITLAPAKQTCDRTHSLLDAPASAVPDGAGAVESVLAITRRWTGSFALADGADLAQLPVAVRQIDYRVGRSGMVVGWGDNQQSATVHVGLAALRGLCTGAGSPAAGLTEQRWLLDGALRLLVEQAEPLAEVPQTDLAPEPLRILRGLLGQVAGPIRLGLLAVPGVSWPLARIQLAEPAEILGLGWGPDAGRALLAALGTAVTRVQVDQLGAVDRAGSQPNTDMLSYADETTVTALAAELNSRAAKSAQVYQGRCRPSGQFAPATPIWSGPVQLVQHARASADE